MKNLIEELLAVLEDETIPKNIRIRIESAIGVLRQEDIEESIRANKALQELDELSNDPNVPSYVRPQLWNIVSKLEAL